MYSAFIQNANYKTELLANDLHPSDAGYVVMANTWWAAISNLLPAQVAHARSVSADPPAADRLRRLGDQSGVSTSARAASRLHAVSVQRSSTMNNIDRANIANRETTMMPTAWFNVSSPRSFALIDQIRCEGKPAR